MERALIVFAQGVGVLTLVMGGLWALQGAGFVTWPADSVMIGQREWVSNGLTTMAIGAGILALVQHRKRK